jgi:hypothetical protein
LLMFGQEPRLPVDHLLGVDAETEDDAPQEVDEWVAGHQNRLSDAFHRAKVNMEREAEGRRGRLNQNTKDHGIPVGSTVFCRNRGWKGRNKIQDWWDPTPYIVLDRPYADRNVYSV